MQSYHIVYFITNIFGIAKTKIHLKSSNALGTRNKVINHPPFSVQVTSESGDHFFFGVGLAFLGFLGFRFRVWPCLFLGLSWDHKEISGKAVFLCCGKLPSLGDLQVTDYFWEIFVKIFKNLISNQCFYYVLNFWRHLTMEISKISWIYTREKKFQKFLNFFVRKR